MEDLVKRVSNTYLTNNSAEFSGETHPDAKHKSWDKISEEGQKYIYESPDGGKTIYKRKAGDYQNQTELFDDNLQLELFPPNDVY